MDTTIYKPDKIKYCAKIPLIFSQHSYENEFVCQNDDSDADDFDVTVYRVLWFHLYLSLLYLKDFINERLLH